MTFRDDRDAAHARAEALDREVKRLEEENAELRAERDRVDAEREALAAREADAQQRRAKLEALAERAPAPPKPASKPRGEDPAREAAAKARKALRNACIPKWATVCFGIASALVVFAAALVGMLLLAWTGILFPPLILPVMMGAGLAMHGAYILVGNYFVKRTRAWLSALPFPFHVDSYMHRLGTRFDEIIQIYVDFQGRDARKGKERNLLIKAVTNGMPGATASWDGESLAITSPRFDVTSTGKHVKYNVEPHRWFVQLATEVLVPMAAVHDLSVRLR